MPSSLKIIVENEEGVVSVIHHQENSSDTDDSMIYPSELTSSPTVSGRYLTPTLRQTESTAEKEDKLSSLFSRLGLKNNKPSPQHHEISSKPFLQPLSLEHTPANSFPLLLAPSNKNRRSRMVFSSPSEEGESAVREVLSALSSRFHSNHESKSSSCITKPKKMKSNSNSSHRFLK